MSTTESGGSRGGAATQVKEQGGELVSQAQQQVQEKAHELRGEASTRFREQVDQRSTQAGQETRAIGQALRRSSQQLRTEGKDTPARVVEQVAERADRLGGYLESADANRLLRDVEDFARSRPWLTGAAAAAAGFLASRFLKASSSRRYEQSYGSNGRDAVPSVSSSTRGLPAGGV
jgi:ElaB/YqjD/DUF883 family membrane-anchored ribosome-binding protein